MRLIRKQNGSVHLSRTVEIALRDSGYNITQAYDSLATFIGAEMVYCHNSGSRLPRTIGGRIPSADIQRYGMNRGHGFRLTLPPADERTQHEQLLAHILAVAKNGRREQREQRREENREQRDEQREEIPQEQEQEQELPQEDEQEDEREQENGSQDFLRWIRQVRAYQTENEMKPWGYRQAERAAMLIRAGFPEAAIKDSFLIDADDEMRHVLGVRPFDLIEWGRTIDAENPLRAVVAKTAQAGVNGCAIGDAGVGKTTALRAYAEEQEIPYGILSCSPTATRTKLFGFLTPGIGEGFKLSSVSQLLLRAEAGENVVVIIDEADALSPDDALDMNAMLANGEVDHPYLGRSIKFGQNVQFFAAMNTTGNGADEHFTGRDKQDAAFLDRFFRFRVELDENVESEIFANLLSA